MNKEFRKYHVLAHVIHEYVSTAVPVSSKVVADRMHGNISSATVRNIMAELERAGFLEQPHTSAGRIPTQKGYRYYVDAIKDQIRFAKAEAQRLTLEYDKRINTIEDIIEKTSSLISRELHNIGMVMWPSISDFYLKRIELIKLRAETVLAVLVTMTNAVKNYVIKLDEEPDIYQLDRIKNYINTNFEFLPFSSILEKLKCRLDDNPISGEERFIKLAKSAMTIIDSIIKENIDREIYCEGLDYFLGETILQDSATAQNVFKIFSKKKDLIELMCRELPNRGINIYIGKENICSMLTTCSIITCGYSLGGKAIGRIGVIGPTRMDYDRALGTISCLSDIVSLKLEEINT